MNFHDFSEHIQNSTAFQIDIHLPTIGSMPAHFHITEVGVVSKEFVDCGGIRRSEAACVLQTLVAHDEDHRLAPKKLAGILSKAASLGLSGELPVELEIQGKTIEYWRVRDARTDNDRLVIDLEAKQTACLAPDRCGLDVLPIAEKCDGTSGCC